jgi:hypothetical protein
MAAPDSKTVALANAANPSAPLRILALNGAANDSAQETIAALNAVQPVSASGRASVKLMPPSPPPPPPAKVAVTGKSGN